MLLITGIVSRNTFVLLLAKPLGNTATSNALRLLKNTIKSYVNHIMHTKSKVKDQESKFRTKSIIKV